MPILLLKIARAGHLILSGLGLDRILSIFDNDDEGGSSGGFLFGILIATLISIGGFVLFKRLSK
jgi:hypothetical protein